MNKLLLAAPAALFSLLSATSAMANSDEDIKLLQQEIKNIKSSYETRISELETKLVKLQKENSTHEIIHKSDATSKKNEKEFNHSLELIVNGQASSFSRDNTNITGVAIGEEGERGNEGLSLNESELIYSADIDDKFAGRLTAAIAREDGEDHIELEEAYIKTLSGIGLPSGLSLKAGRALWSLGYMNNYHAHEDDFADRPLPYRAFLNKAFNDDGLELSYVLPTKLYTEIGGGLFRGDDFPGGDAKGENPGAYSIFARVGSDIGSNQRWRLGGSMLHNTDISRATNEDTVFFRGDSNIYIADFRYVWEPTGNSENQEVTLQGEYFWRDEKGTYEDVVSSTGAVLFNDMTEGWYAQAVYKFLPQWRAGVRYTKLEIPDLPIGLIGTQLDAGGSNPYVSSVMLDWSNSESSRVRLQYNNDHTGEKTDNQFILQYIMNLGTDFGHSH